MLSPPGEIEDKMVEKGEASRRRGDRKEDVQDMLGRLHLHEIAICCITHRRTLVGPKWVVN
jgi:hypothetical protein